MSKMGAKNEFVANTPATVATLATVSRWIVLRCRSSDTLRLMRMLSDDEGRYGDLGAWTPIWKRLRRYPRSTKTRLIEQPAMPSFIFVPEGSLDRLPIVPGRPFSLMKFDDFLVRVPDSQLAPLRRIDTQPKDPIAVLPKIGALVRFVGGPFEGIKGKVVYATQRYATVKVEGFHNPIQVPPSILQETC